MKKWTRIFLLGATLAASAILLSACVGYVGAGPDYYGPAYGGRVFYGHPYYGGGFWGGPGGRRWR
jgi:predicted small secreted protein